MSHLQLPSAHNIEFNKQQEVLGREPFMDYFALCTASQEPGSSFRQNINKLRPLFIHLWPFRYYG